tara:strand:- start:10908 stop:13397 length:2490 start_codon:yes stop_codon:yes gene_type:complete
MSSVARKMLQAAAGSAKKDYLEDYFSVTYYTGNSSYCNTAIQREIETGVDISVDGGCMFFYNLNGGGSGTHAFVSTDYNGGLQSYFSQEVGNSAFSDANGIQSLTLDGVRKGFKMANSTKINLQNDEYAVVTFRKKEKFMASMVVDSSTGWDDVPNPLNSPPIAAWYFRIDATQAPLYWQSNIGTDMGSSSQYYHIEWDNTGGVPPGSYGAGDGAFWDYSPGNTSTLLQLGTTVRSTGFGKEGILVMLGGGYDFSHDGLTPAIRTFGWYGDGTSKKGWNTQGSGFSNGGWKFTDDQWFFHKRADDDTTTPSNAHWYMYFDKLGINAGSGYEGEYNAGSATTSQYYISHNKNNNTSYYGTLNNATHHRAFSGGYYITTSNASHNSNGVFYMGLAVSKPSVLQEPVSGEQVVSIRDGLTPSFSDYPNRGNSRTNDQPKSGMVQGLFDSSDVQGISPPDFVIFNGDGTSGNEKSQVCTVNNRFPNHYFALNHGATRVNTGKNISTNFHNAYNEAGGSNTALQQTLGKFRDGYFINSVDYTTTAGGASPFTGGTNNSAADVTFAYFKARPKVMSFSSGIEGDAGASFHYHNLDGGAEMVWIHPMDGGAYNNWYVYHKAFSTGSLYDMPDYIRLNSSEAKTTVTSANYATQHPFLGYDPMLVSNNYVYVNTNVLIGSGNNHPYQFCAWKTFPGVTKVGTYTGTGSNLTVDCSFSGPARFILIKRYDDAGKWYMFLNDPRSNTAGGNGMVINASGEASVIAWPWTGANPSTSEQIATDDGAANRVLNSYDRWRGNYFNAGAAGSGMEGGFKLSNHSDATDTININGASYLFLAIA